MSYMANLSDRWKRNSAVEYSAVQYNAMQYSEGQCSSIQCSSVWCNAILNSAVKYSATVQCNANIYSMCGLGDLICRETFTLPWKLAVLTSPHWSLL